jgi:hypothetical protein
VERINSEISSLATRAMGIATDINIPILNTYFDCYSSMRNSKVIDNCFSYLFFLELTQLKPDIIMHITTSYLY